MFTYITVQQFVKEGLGASNVDTWPKTMLAAHFIWSFTQCRDVWYGHCWWWNIMFSIRPGNKTTEHAVENTEFTSAKKTRMSQLQVKNMLVCFFDHKRIVQYDLIAQGQTVNQPCYLEVLTRLQECVRRKRPGLWPDKWILHHDNAPAHNVLWVREFLAKNSITKMDHPPYSPDLATPAIFGSFQN